MKNKDVIFVSNSLATGGAARVLCLLANHFAAGGSQVGILVFNRREGEYSVDPKVEKDYLSEGGGRSGRLRRARWIRHVAKQNPHATIVAFEYFVNIAALAACFALPNRVIVSERNDPARVGSGFPRDQVRKLLYRTANTLVCQTDEAAAYFSDGIRKKVILNPIKPDLPDVVDTERRKTVVTFCRLEAQKNLAMLITAFAEFHAENPDYSLEIYGDGAERESLTRLVDSLSLDGSVSILPGRADIHHAVRDCAMFVLPSNYEGLSNSMIEAMALGLPTICTDCPCGGARMVIDDGENGILIPVGDANSLSRAMSRVAADQQLATKLSENARMIRARLSLKAVADEWETVMFEPEKAG